jgi:hypothetical protein
MHGLGFNGSNPESKPADVEKAETQTTLLSMSFFQLSIQSVEFHSFPIFIQNHHDLEEIP